MMCEEERLGPVGDPTWKRLSKDEKEHLKNVMKRPLDDAYRRLAGKCDSQTLVLLAMGEMAASLSIGEITHLIAGRYGGNADAEVVARKIGKAIRAGLVRETPGRRYALTPDGQANLAKYIK